MAKRSTSVQKKALEFSKKCIDDMVPLLWIVTVGGFLLAFLCAILRFDAAFPWIAALVGLPYSAYGTACSFYMNLAKSDHRGADGAGITFAAAQARNFMPVVEDSQILDDDNSKESI